MRRIFEFDLDAVIPERGRIQDALELGRDQKPPERITKLIDTALLNFRELSLPRGVMETITIEEFDSIYPGEGLNEQKTPLAEIYPQASQLALFAVTLGSEVSSRIEGLFEANDFALGYVLDGVASEAAELTADRLEGEFDRHLVETGAKNSSSAQLRYSPGYCGWHISGQKKLFTRLRPSAIGIELNASYLMQPLKSISGILVSGEKDIHFFNNNYKFCAVCTTQSCRERLKHILKTEEENA